MKRTKNILLISLTGLFSFFSVATLGFGAFILDKEIEKVSDNISVEVGNIDTEVCSISDISIDDGHLSFDASKNDTTPPIIGDGVHDEDLSISISFTLTTRDVTKISSVSAKINVIDPASTEGENFIQSISSNYIIPPAIYEQSKAILDNLSDDKTIDNGSGKGMVSTVITNHSGDDYQISSTLSFNWGSSFNFLNPSIYATNDNYLDVLDALEVLNKANTTKFNIVLTVNTTI